MKIKVHRSKISNKRYEKFAFPRYSRKELNEQQSDGAKTSITKVTLTRAPVIYNEIAVVGFYAIKNFKEIKSRMQSEPEKFGKYLNKFVSTYSDIVLSDQGNVGKFSGVGTYFTFKCGSKPKESVLKTLVAALKMRYILNKLNREWNFYHNEAWQAGFGVDIGEVEIQEHKEDRSTYVTVTGKTEKIAKGIARSAGSSQVLLTESMYMQFPFLETSFDIKPPRHVPVKDENYVSKIREVVGMVGPQAKKIYEVYV